MAMASAGELVTRAPISDLAETLAGLMWPDDSDDVEGVVDRLLSVADHQRGAEAMADAAFDVFKADARTAAEAWP